MVEKWKIAILWLLLTALLIITGCATTYTFHVDYQTTGEPRRLIPEDKNLVLFLGPVAGTSDKLWYRIGKYEWFLDESPVSLVEKGLSRALQRMGITPTSHPSRAQGRLEAEIRWFGPYGPYYRTAAIIISLTLYSGNEKEPLWQVRLRGGSHSNDVVFTPSGVKSTAGKAVSEALSQALRQLRWKPDFFHALSLLSLESATTGKTGDMRKAPERGHE